MQQRTEKQEVGKDSAIEPPQGASKLREAIDGVKAAVTRLEELAEEMDRW